MDALKKMYEMPPDKRQAMGLKGRRHVTKNYNFEQYQDQWVKLFENIVENYGSWQNRKNYSNWALEEIK